MKSTLVSLVIILAVTIFAVPRPVEAAPNTSGGVACTSQGKAISSITSESQCEACGGAWEVSSWGCGGGILSGSLVLIGSLVTGNVFGAAGGVLTLIKAKDECNGKCQAKV